MKRTALTSCCLLATCLFADIATAGVIVGSVVTPPPVIAPPRNYGATPPGFGGPLFTPGPFAVSTALTPVPPPVPVTPSTRVHEAPSIAVGPSGAPLENRSTVTLTSIDNAFAIPALPPGPTLSPFSWTLTSTAWLSKVTFEIAPSDPAVGPAPFPGGIMFAGLLTPPPGWAVIPVSPTRLTFFTPTSVAPGALPFGFGIAIPDTGGGPANWDLSMVASNPEPGSLLLGGIGMLAGAFVSRRKRKNSGVEADGENPESSPL